MLRNYLKYLFILICLQASTLYAQKEANIWYFGNHAGVDFNGDEPVALTNSPMYAWDGCATISDFDGNLLFFTNGINVWNSNLEDMPNGDYLMGDGSSTQAAVIVKKPGPNLIYIIFTLDAFLEEDGLRYTEVDMLLEGGLGAVNENKNIPIVSPTCEKVIAVLHENQMDYWIITMLPNNAGFQSYLLTEYGISDPIVSTTGLLGSAIGYLRASRDGSRIAFGGEGLGILDFNNETGELSNPIFIDQGTYGVEFNKDARP